MLLSPSDSDYRKAGDKCQVQSRHKQVCLSNTVKTTWSPGFSNSSIVHRPSSIAAPCRNGINPYFWGVGLAGMGDDYDFLGILADCP